MTERLARSQLKAGHIELNFPIRPYTAQWNYQGNSVSRDTLGGRVVQLLSISISNLSVTSVAGSRTELQRIADGIKDIMKFHIETSRPAEFRVPSRNWSFRVYISAMPQIGWDVAATTYPYQLEMAVDEDLTGVKRAQILRSELERLSEGVGYTAAFSGGNAEAFEKVVSAALAAHTFDDGSSSGGTGNSTIGGGDSGISPDKSALTVDEMVKLAAWALKNQFPSMSQNDLVKNTVIAVAVAYCESTWHVGSNNPNATNSIAYGLWQADSHQNGVSVHDLQTAEGNAIWMAKELAADYGLTQSGNPHPVRTWEHAWWAYWSCYRDGNLSQQQNAQNAASKYF